MLTFSAWWRCRAAQEFRAGQRLCPASKVKMLIMRRWEGQFAAALGLTSAVAGASTTLQPSSKSWLMAL